MHHWNVLIALHAVAATFAVFTGLVVLRTPRKGNRFHRRLGGAWMIAMYGVVISSFWIRALHPGHLSWIHGLSAWTLFTLTTGLWAARTGRRELHRGMIVGSYFGLLGAGVAAMAFPVRLAPQLLVHRPVIFAGVVLAVGCAVALLVAAQGGTGRLRRGS